jgi:hypothetical protein
MRACNTTNLTLPAASAPLRGLRCTISSTNVRFFLFIHVFSVCRDGKYRKEERSMRACNTTNLALFAASATFGGLRCIISSTNVRFLLFILAVRLYDRTNLKLIVYFLTPPPPPDRNTRI